MVSPSRFALLLLALAALPACIEAENPCDPGADPALQGEGTSLSGAVHDTDGTPVGGIPVSLTGRPETAVSAEDGRFTFSNLPPASSYEVNALPSAPLLGGRTKTGALVCKGTLTDVIVNVVVPPSSPEVELVKASGDRRLLVAFGGLVSVDEVEAPTMYEKPEDEEGPTDYRAPDAVMHECESGILNGDVSFRVQVRSPFGTWQNAVLTPFPWSASPPRDDPGSPADERLTVAELSESKLYMPRVDDFCSAALCSQFAYLDESLAAPLARCAEVVGVVDDTGPVASIEPLEPFASYHVRVVADKKTPEALRLTAALPVHVEGALAASTGQISLVPGTVLDVANTDGTVRDSRADDVLGITVVAGGRFTAITQREVVVISDAADTMDEAGRDAFGGGMNPSAADEASGENASASMYGGDPTTMRPLGVLSAGKWVRVLRKTDTGETDIAKLYIGTSALDGADGPNVDEATNNDLTPSLSFDAESPELGSVRAIGYVLREPGKLADVGVSPEDAYLVLYRGAFVLLEHTRRVGPLALANINTKWANSAGAVPDDGAGAAGNCAALGISFGVVDNLNDAIGASRRVRHCYDVEAALGEDVSLADIEVLDGPGGGVFDGFQLFTDALNDRVLVAKTVELACRDCNATPIVLAERLAAQAVRVGREPTGMSRSALIDACVAGEEPVRTPVVLVANRRGGDISVLQVQDDIVQETVIIPVPTNVVGFLDDADGPDCADPFAWALGEDGRVFPIDMRGVPSIPLCDGQACEVGTRGRGVAGAVARPVVAGVTKRARAVVGGPGLLGELGFFKPKALDGAAIVDEDQFAEETVSAGQR